MCVFMAGCSICGDIRGVEAFDGWRQLDGFLRYAAERIAAERRLNNHEVLRYRAANGD